VRELGGLHRFMDWDGPILTDSGGYQVFSLGHIARIDDDGVTLRSVVDGALVRFTPERVVDIQRKLGADVAMAFDHCPPDPTQRGEVEAACERTRAGSSAASGATASTAASPRPGALRHRAGRDLRGPAPARTSEPRSRTTSPATRSAA
jgi:queuine tRNA-ribosyltransferase